jgi:hypothetical protein
MDMWGAISTARGVESTADDGWVLTDLGYILFDCYQRTKIKIVADLEEAVSLFREKLKHREALEMCPFPDPYRPSPLFGLAVCLGKMYNETRALPHLQEAISHLEELVEIHDLVRDPDRLEILRCLAPLLQMRSDATGQTEDLPRIARLNAEASRLERELGVGVDAEEEGEEGEEEGRRGEEEVEGEEGGR